MILPLRIGLGGGVKKFVSLLFVLGALLASTIAWTAPYPTKTQFEDAIAAIAPMVKQQAGLEVIAESGGGWDVSLMAANLARGKCRIVYDLEPTKEIIQDFFLPIADENLAAWLRAIVVHEATHCVQYKDAFMDGHLDGIVPPQYSRQITTIEAFILKRQEEPFTLWREAASDIAAVLYLAEEAPSCWRILVSHLYDIRRREASSAPEHDTSAWILGMLNSTQEPLVSQSNLFEAAFTLRVKLQP